MATDVYGEFEWRDMVYAGTESVREVLAREKVTCYIGFDPTASSLHVGSLLPLMSLARMQRFGHSPIALVGGGTGMIGDPSGKTQERQLLGLEQIEENVRGIRAQVAKFLDFDAPVNPARIVNNADWLASLNLMSFLRDTGKYFTVNYMLAKESVRRRLESEEGISYTEFTYSLLQAFDFLTLFDRFNCTLQMGGSDQWGNITAGTDLVRKLRGARAHGLVLPLVTTASGVKFGKTEAGAVWLDAGRTSPFKFYQFWLNTADADAVRYLKYFTFFAEDEIAALAREVETAAEKREAQRALARHVTRMLHGQDAVDRVERASSLLFSEKIAELEVADVLAVFEDVPSTLVPLARLDGDGAAITELLVETSLASSKGEAARLVKAGGVYVNNRRLTNERERLQRAHAIGGCVLILRKGKQQQHVVRAVEDVPGAAR